MATSNRKNIVPLPSVTPVASGNSAATPPRSSSQIVTTESKPTYPYPDSVSRLERYKFNSLLFDGNHFDAFKIKVDNELYNKNYSRLRYIVNNFPGLISKICADMLFGDHPRITLPEGSNNDNNHKWLENWHHDTEFFTTLYESAMTSSYKGDTVFKLRVGPLSDPKNPSVIVEQVQPDFYFPTLNPLNISAKPTQEEISFIIQIGKDEYLRKEIHTAGTIRNELWKMKGTEIIAQMSFAQAKSLLQDPDFVEEESTGIDRILLVHVPNWKDGRTYFGNDDYQDLTTLFYAINNRITKVDNILDKHSDPILAIPEGILDEEGHVKREHLGLFEKGPDGDKPEYVVWDAQLEAAFNQIDRLFDSLYMFSEISPDAMGRFNDTTDVSGRALKYRMMRTVAKVKRKQLYFDQAIKEVVYLAQLLATEHGIKALGVGYTGAPEIPSVEWHHPIPQDSYEQSQEEELRLASGNQTIKDSIMNIDGLTEDQAEEKLAEIKAENELMNPPIAVPVDANGNPLPPDPDTATPGQSPNSTPSGKTMKSIQVPKTTKPADVSQ
jgi:hypothetical protein